MAYHTHKLSDTTLEEETCEFLCLELLLISYNAYFISLDIEEISFLLAPQIVEVEQNLWLHSELSTNKRTISIRLTPIVSTSQSNVSTSSIIAIIFMCAKHSTNMF